MTAREVVSSPRLTLRRPVAADAAAYVRIHRDPRTYTHAPYAMAPTDEAARGYFDALLAAWETGRGYWTATLPTGEVVGFAGAARRDHGEGPFLNLYYRLDPAFHGRGLAREAARLTTAFVTEHDADLPLRAVIRSENAASIATARRAGLEQVGTTTHPGDPADAAPSLVFEAPRVTRHTAFTDAEREAVLDLWQAVNDAGGAVGFLPGAPRHAVAERLAAHEAGMADGSVVAGLMRAPDGAVTGLGFLVREANPLMWHGRTVKRVMTDPTRRSRGLGRTLMAGLHRIARADGVELLSLDVRSGYGTEAFYEACGYREVGRIVGAIRVAPEDDRDDIIMSRRLDG